VTHAEAATGAKNTKTYRTAREENHPRWKGERRSLPKAWHGIKGILPEASMGNTRRNPPGKGRKEMDWREVWGEESSVST